ncbi:hypothetical protein TWF569_004256 [Orbilia oligospora]|uniref:Rho-GAP domain-containing protein n=3 Tax=Orbilia oligospora TaxID=2813651 RepID=A0A7C8J4P1_ORBOL|nr:hypothetical protein TWF103_001694 [Orbilia oligospora]KAF3088665.1 hypothetical protein TWF706_010675 [Orbilia oligospora]KAF3094414.1 hypothetical protein TWF102_007539 [Orbilia oligospora]KAF3119300.1 hypothetical protein TWF569_004256 [Orbilia oligospora]KAF3120269.1 hypothetical protein TWF594_003937 [Orbilia oligospora]
MASGTGGHPFASPASPPTKASLTSWWDKFKKGNPKKEEPKEEAPPGIFGVPLQESIKYAKVAISMNDQNGNSFIYGYIPIVIAKCGVFLKDKATDVEGIFRLSGSAKRIKDLQVVFNSPDKYGKGLDWAGYTVHDAANILRRYLNQLPEPIIPLDYYDKFRQPLSVGGTIDDAEAIKTYQRLISELPPLNRQLLLYILDLLAVFSSKADVNLMPAANLAAIFQPGIISHPDHEMSPADYRLSQDVLIFLILNQDNFLLGMRGSDENDDNHHEDKVPSEGYQPSSESPRNQSKNGLDRHPSNASAGAESVKKFGIQRHNSTSSRKSVSSPIVGPIGLSRSNTVPSKNRSPSVTTPTFPPRTPQSPRMPVSPRFPQKGQMTEGISPEQEVPDNVPEKATATLTLPMGTVAEQPLEKLDAPRQSSSHGEKTTSEFSEMVSPVEPPTNNDTQSHPPHAQGATEQPNATHPLRTPTKEKGFSSYFARSPGSETERKTSNKLRKKRIPGSQNPSAESSTASLNGTTSHPPLAIAQQIPPASNPTSQQPPLLPISASPPNDLPALDTRTPSFQANIQASTPTDAKQLEPPAPGVPHGKGVPSASTSSLVQQVSQTPSQASSLSSQSSQPDDGKLGEKPKQKSIWRKSAQKLNLGSAQATAQATADKLSGLISPPFVKPLNSNGSMHSLNSKGRRRSHSVGEKAGEAPKEVSTLPQRGASASGQHASSTENLGAIGWLQKKINERKEKGEKERDASAGPPQFPMLLPTTPIAEVETPISPKR